MNFTEKVFIAPKLKSYVLDSPRKKFPYNVTQTELLREF